MIFVNINFFVSIFLSNGIMDIFRNYSMVGFLKLDLIRFCFANKVTRFLLVIESGIKMEIYLSS